jgi:hypothetical protein
MNSIKNKPAMSLWVGGLFLIAYMALFLGIALRFEAASRARQENAEWNEWQPNEKVGLLLYLYLLS